jgi:pantoate--beta-alanine ligase
MVVRRMMRQLALPIDIVAGETAVADDGLALSSRNGYLDAVQRAEAANLSRVLRGIERAVRYGRTDYQVLETLASERLRQRGWQPDYVAIRRQADLGEPTATPELLVALAAARLGTTRLIDNVDIAVPAQPCGFAESAGLTAA